jgi:hypothetical protein
MVRSVYNERARYIITRVSGDLVDIGIVHKNMISSNVWPACRKKLFFPIPNAFSALELVIYNIL